MKIQTNRIAKFLVTTGLVLVATLTFQYRAIAGPVENEVRKLSWASADIEILQAALPDKEKVRILLGELFGDDEIVSSVGDYKIDDIDDDSYAELVVTYDVSGRGFYNAIMIIRNSGNKLTQNVINGFGVGALDKHLVDVNGDHIKEILVPRLVGLYQGSKPAAIVPYVYSYAKGAYRENSSNFRGYYINTVKPPIQKSLDDINQGRTNLTDEERPMWTSKYQSELDTIAIIIGE